MRSSRQPRPKATTRSAAQCAATVTRLFTPAALDLDDLAAAIRSLLGPDIVQQIASPDATDRGLLRPRPRVTHVVEATPAP
jgi:hypothetical protein